ncbi:MAG TPA: hypothetical protein VFA77_17850, partial [Candidatus Eisenbacteria bacterium]|nr:hypothetical protein [Candidatus Eisenbacteria bacterium]
MKPNIQPCAVINFTGPQLQKCYESNFAKAGGFSAALRPVCALIAAHKVFPTFEKPHSSRVHET